ncbi:hypothetical protein [Ureibacillus acetophenoni]|uniref:Uncharacterized protein n=1 Tax=Ureibacillus acetophenoni TaxID=614649 RepID=A0A285U9W0_9BACL|nr:hypothetical protein [Ureibacillus acetophenoni]SOC38612.1 hypothetical protein SAMN05877842_104193 [Ureibacillus acetophenoni]
MKKAFIFPTIIILFLAACSSEQPEESITNVSPTIEEEVEEVQEERLDWLGLSDEEKIKIVEEELETIGYGGYPVEEIIEKLDERYESGPDLDFHFPDTFASIIDYEFKEMKMVSWGQQYGDDYFAEDDEHHIKHVIEDNENVYVIHGFNDFRSLFYSVAKDGYWEERDVPLFANDILPNAIRNAGLNPESYDFFKVKVVYHNNHIYTLVRDKAYMDKNNILIDFVMSESGVVENGITQGVAYDPTFLITNKGKLALLKGHGEEVGIFYVEDLTTPIKTFTPTHDFSSRLALSTNTVDNVYYVEDSGLMYTGDSSLYILDTNNGQPVWDSFGQEYEYDFNVRKNLIDFITEDRFLFVNEKTDTITIHDTNLAIKGEEIDIPFDIRTGSIRPEFWFTSNDTEFTIWNKIRYQGKSSLQFVKIRKGIDYFVPSDVSSDGI